MSTSELHPIFSECMNGNVRDVALTQPFTHDGFSYVTDLWILVRCQAVPSVSRTLKDWRFTEASIKFPPEPALRTVPIPDVAQFRQCEKCKGEKLVTTTSCDRCDDVCGPFCRAGTPIQFDCPYCKGTGLEESFDPVQLSDDPPIYAPAYYLAMLRKHGVMSIDICSRHPNVALRFLGIGFEGMLQPMSTEFAKTLQERKRK